MIDFNNEPREFRSWSIPTISSEGADLLAVPEHDEFGQVIHVIPAIALQQLRPHPAATIFPCLKADIDRMRHSLEESGQQQHITLYGCGSEIVFDGNCRKQAAVELGIPLTAVWIGDDELGGYSPEEWVFRRNRANEGDRRLNDTQRALVAVRVGIGKARREAAARKASGVNATEDSGEAYTFIAREYKLPPNRCRQAMKICDSRDEKLFDLVYRGILSISQAAEIASKSANERTAVIKAALSKRGEKTWQDALQVIKRTRKALEKSSAVLDGISMRCAELAVDRATDIEQASKIFAAAIETLNALIRNEQAVK